MRKLLAIAVVTLLGPGAFAAGEVYRWKDANGSLHYSDQPRPGAEAMRVTSGQTELATNSAPAAPAAPVAATPPPTNASDTPLPVSKDVAQQVRQEAATAKSKACERARTDYDQKIQAQRIHRTDAKGNVTYLSAAEIDAARLEARAARDLACTP